MKVCITIDADWAPVEVIDSCVGILHEKNIPYTFFATDDYRNGIVKTTDVAWHPNFLSDKRLVKSELEYFSQLIPHAKGLRPHRLFMPIEEISRSWLDDYGIKWTSRSSDPFKITPDIEFDGIPNFYINWGDYFYFTEKRLPDWDLMVSKKRGLYIANFHPIHLFLNTDEEDRYLQAKKNYHNISKLRSLQNKNQYGVRNVFFDVLKLLGHREIEFITISDAYESLDEII
jgi:hypothetical protein